MAEAPTPLPVIPPADERPACVTVGWLADNPGLAAKLEYLDHQPAAPRWLPASEAIDSIDPGWPVEVREAQS